MAAERLLLDVFKQVPGYPVLLSWNDASRTMFTPTRALSARIDRTPLNNGVALAQERPAHETVRIRRFDVGRNGF